MNLAIDIGNTLVKLAVYDKGQMTGLEILENISLPDLVRFADAHAGIDSAILATVKDYPEEVENYLQKHFRFFIFNPSTPVPYRDFIYHTGLAWA